MLDLHEMPETSSLARSQGSLMSVNPISAQDAIARMGLPLGTTGAYSAIIDARTEDEYALDHLPGAQNWPSLNNAERIVIGTLYKQVGPF